MDRAGWTPPRFNPLHCGAVVASSRGTAASRSPRVSIPFIAGQWSLPSFPRPGARPAPRVSIPFIAGQWSLPQGGGARRKEMDLLFQSPSLRGSGRFAGPHPLWERAIAEVSIPFIAGQWSLREASWCSRRWPGSFNPLHCGAVVASLSGSRPRMPIGFCFNPLHCGAVVASPGCRLGFRRRVERFNPLHCGAVVASKKMRSPPAAWRRFQSPSLRGSGRFGPAGRAPVARLERFNPLHCGAVVASPPR